MSIRTLNSRRESFFEKIDDFRQKFRADDRRRVSLRKQRIQNRVREILSSEAEERNQEHRS